MKRFPKTPYSPEVVRLRTVTKHLRQVIQCKAYPDLDWETLLEEHTDKLAALDVELLDDLVTCRQFLKEHAKTLRATEAAEERDATARTKFQEAKIAEYTDSGNKEAVDAIRKIQRAEATARVFRQCATARGLNRDGGLSYVSVPSDPETDPKQCPDDQWSPVVDPKEVEQTIRDRLRKHFSQSKDCNLTSPPVDTTMLFSAGCEMAEQILTGTFDTSHLDDTTAALLECFTHALGTEPAVSATLSEDDLLGKIKVWNEKTSTSPKTNVHLGHAKAYIAKPTCTRKQKSLKYWNAPGIQSSEAT